MWNIHRLRSQMRWTAFRQYTTQSHMKDSKQSNQETFISKTFRRICTLSVAWVIYKRLIRIREDESYNGYYSIGGYGFRFFYGDPPSEQLVEEATKLQEANSNQKNHTKLDTIPKVQRSRLYDDKGNIMSHKVHTTTNIEDAEVLEFPNGLRVISGYITMGDMRIAVHDAQPQAWRAGSKRTIVMNAGSLSRVSELQRKLASQTRSRVISISKAGLTEADNVHTRAYASSKHAGIPAPDQATFLNSQKKDTSTLPAYNPFSPISAYTGVGRMKHSRTIHTAHEHLNKADISDIASKSNIPPSWKGLKSGCAPTTGPVSTSNNESYEISHLLQQLEVEDDPIFIGYGYNWLSTLKAAKRNIENIRGVVLIDPHLPFSKFPPMTTPRMQLPFSQTNAHSDDTVMEKLPWITPFKLRGTTLFADQILAEVYFRDLLFAVGPNKRLRLRDLDASEWASPRRAAVRSAWKVYATTDPRVEYLSQQLVGLIIEDYKEKANICQQSNVTGTDLVRRLATKLSCSPSMWQYASLHMFDSTTEDALVKWIRQGQPSDADWFKSNEHASGLAHLVSRSFSKQEWKGKPLSILITQQTDEQLRMDSAFCTRLGFGSLNLMQACLSSPASPQELALRKLLQHYAANLSNWWMKLFPGQVFLVHRDESKLREPWDFSCKEIADHIERLFRISSSSD